MMPSSMTHTYFGMDVYEELSAKSKKLIDSKVEYFKLFCQGSDPFMFYHFLLGKKAKEMTEIQEKMHQEKTQKFFLNTIQYIHEHKLQNDAEAMTYLYGYICHYYLDLYAHPYLYYKSGIFRKRNKNTYKYNGLHQQIEYAIDLYFISKRETDNPAKFKIHHGIFGNASFSSPLKDLINYSIGTTYSIDNSVNKYWSSIQYMKKFFYIANYDPYGIKLKFYKLIDKFKPKRIVKFEELSFYNRYDEVDDYLNLERHKWCYPWDKRKVFTSSFLDLYEVALKDAVSTIKDVTNILDNKILDLKRIKQLFPNLSYVTGKPCYQKLEMKYFEF